MSIIKIVDADDPKENDAANNERRKPRRENVTHTHTPMSHVTVAVWKNPWRDAPDDAQTNPRTCLNLFGCRRHTLISEEILGWMSGWVRAYGGQKFSSGMLAGILSDHRFQLARSRNKSVRILFSVSFSELRWRQSHGLSLWRPFPGFFDRHSGGILPRCLGCLLLSRPDTHTHTHIHTK